MESLTASRMPDFTQYLTHKPEIQGFFDPATNTISYVVADSAAKICAIIDSVMDYEPHSATISYQNADAIIAYIRNKEYAVAWILETHMHADHLTAAFYLKEKLGGQVAISAHITDVQEVFGAVFKERETFKRDGSQFDRLLEDGDTFAIGTIPVYAMHTPGHTPADMVFVIGDAVFAGDTLFMPDYGTARCDFPGGNAETMYHSVQKIFALPDSMRMYMCHDYLPVGRTEYQWETTVGEQKRSNVHLKEGTDTATFIAQRTARDSELGMPTLIIPSIQVNMRAGELPKDDSGEPHLKTPINSVFSRK